MSDFLSSAGEEQAEAGGMVKGVGVAVVTNNQDDEGMGRVKVRFTWRPHDESYWARIAVPMAGAERGTYFLPEVGDEVLVAFDRGDLRHPYVIGALWNGKDKPPATNADGTNRLRRIVTKVGHEITFNDAEDRSILVQAVGGARLLLDDHKIALSDGKGDEIVIDVDGGTATVKSKTSLKLQSPQIEVAADSSLTLKAGGTLTIQGGLVQIN